MAYSTEIAETLTDTLRKFVTLSRHLLVGHVANLEFWLAEVRHATGVIDGYHQRFNAMKTAQERGAPSVRDVVSGSEASRMHVAAKAARALMNDEDSGAVSVDAKAKSVPDGQLKVARVELIDAAYAFLVRCHKAQLIDEPSLRKALESIGTNLDPSDVKR